MIKNFFIIKDTNCKKVQIFLYRAQKMYPFFDQGGNDGNGDYQKDIRWVYNTKSKSVL